MGLSSILLILIIISLFSLGVGLIKKNKLAIWSSLLILSMIVYLIFYFIFLTPDYM
jgi:hypothetical protein